MKKTLLTLLVLSASALVHAIDSSGYDRLLHAYVKDGKVDYVGLKKESATLDAYLQEVGKTNVAQLSSKEDRLVFWINAYNASVLKGVLSHYPTASVMDISGFFDKLTYPIAGEKRTLNDIEGQTRSLKDARVHFALVCASSSCPFLRAEAYTADKLDAQLRDQARHFLADPERGVQLDTKTGRARLSQIFKWYRADFVRGQEGSGDRAVLKTVAEFVDAPTQAKLQSRDWKIDYAPYNWSLNKQ